MINLVQLKIYTKLKDCFSFFVESIDYTLYNLLKNINHELVMKKILRLMIKYNGTCSRKDVYSITANNGMHAYIVDA